MEGARSVDSKGAKTWPGVSTTYMTTLWAIYFFESHQTSQGLPNAQPHSSDWRLSTGVCIGMFDGAVGFRIDFRGHDLGPTDTRDDV